MARVGWFGSLPARASDALVIAVIACLSVTRRYCIKTAKHRITQTRPRDSQGTLVFWHQESLVEDSPFPLKFALKVTHPPFEHQKFDQYPLIAPQPWELAKKVQIALMGSRPRAFERAIDEPCTLPLSPPRVAQNAIFPVNFNFCRKKVCCKVSSCGNFHSGKVVATSFNPLFYGP